MYLFRYIYACGMQYIVNTLSLSIGFCCRVKVSGLCVLNRNLIHCDMIKLAESRSFLFNSIQFGHNAQGV